MYAANHGISAASRFFSIKKAYFEGAKEKRKAQDEGEVEELPLKKHGRSVLLGEESDEK